MAIIKTRINKKINNTVNTIYPYTTSDMVEYTNSTSVKDGLDNIDSILEGFSHNSIFRGKDLGTITAVNIDDFVTSHGIPTGEFTDLYLGDYFTMDYNGNKTFRIAGFDTHWNIGDNASDLDSDVITVLNRHHICVVPDSYLFTHGMNTTNTTGQSENENNTSGLKAYAGSDMFQIVMPEVNATLSAILGSHLLKFRELLSNSIDTNAIAANHPATKGAANGWGWYTCQANLMSEIELYGSIVWSSNGYNTGTAKHQLPLFAKAPKYINPTRTWFWLRDVATAASFCDCSGHGYARYTGASNADGVRPRFLIG